MKTLVLVEHDNAEMKDATLAVVTAASQLGEVHALVIGSGCGSVGEQAAKVAGVTTVHVADDASLANQLPDHLREVLVMAYFHQFAYKDIAEMLSIPLGTVKSRLHAAVGTFAQLWKARYPEKDQKTRSA